MAFSSLATRLTPCSIVAVRWGFTRLSGNGIWAGGKSGAPSGKVPSEGDVGDCIGICPEVVEADGVDA
jgi:hypothetical protein